MSATKFSDYVLAARETADPEAFELEYLIPGIIGEVGELFGQRAKAHWHGKPDFELAKELRNELGDVAWMTAILLDRYGVREIPDEQYEKLDRPYASAIPVSSLLLARIESLHAAYLASLGLPDLGARLIPSSAVELWALIEKRAEQITDGYPFEDVLAANLRKLADRKARGVLKGSGDHR